METAERIFELMRRRGMSQKSFSEKTGIPQSTLSDWKRKGTNPTADKLLTICSVLNVTPYALLADQEFFSGDTVPDAVLIPRDSEDYRFLRKFRVLSETDRVRALGYLDALSGK